MKTIIAVVDCPSNWNRTGTVTTLDKFVETTVLLISYSVSRILHKQVADRVPNMTKSPNTIAKYTQIAEFSLVNTEQLNFLNLVDMVILNMISEVDSNLTTYLKKLLSTNKLEQ